jgi:hypothetical protein
VSEAMLGINASLYVRYEFDYEHDPALLHSLRLLVRYDDAFVAWINGSEVVRDAERSPAEIAWDSFALGSRPDSEGVEFAEFDLTGHTHKLRRGRNVLAVQIMNTSAGSSDLLLQSVLTANQTVAVQPLRLEQSTRLIARTRSGDTWSAPVPVYLPINEDPPSAANLLVSEILYHPADPSSEERAAGFQDAELFEFLELHNPTERPVSLGGVGLGEGIRFNFLQSGLPSIPPGGYLVLVSNLDAFEARYGSGLPVAGAYEGNLRNSGETFTVDTGGVPLISVSFSDQWFSGTDGDGYSLVLQDDQSPPENWSVAEAWRQSGDLHGSPGRAESPGGFGSWLEEHFSAGERSDPAVSGPAADPDRDGGANLVEYALGLDPRAADSARLPRLHVSMENGLRAAELQFDRPAGRASELRFELQTSADLQEWVVDENAAFDVSATGAGFESVRIRPARESGQMYLRLYVRAL